MSRAAREPVPAPSEPFWAHSAKATRGGSESHGRWQPLAEHLESTGRLARLLASRARPDDETFQRLAEVSGLLHDYGKYSTTFQRRIRGSGERCPHAIHGAALAYLGVDGRTTGLPSVAAAIAGHHAGLPDFLGGTASLQSRILEQQRSKEASALWEPAQRDCPAVAAVVDATGSWPTPPESCSDDLYIRMLFSCLVDADRLDSADRKPSEAPLLAAERLKALLTHIESLAASSPDGDVRRMRAQVLADCLVAAESPNRLMSLSVPTGGGKTLAAMAFALRRAELKPEDFRRVIVVIPYLSIIEQNAEVYTRIFGADAVLEHHSGMVSALRATDGTTFLPEPEADDDDRFQRSGLREETENWNAPLVVTTSVRFFESLFSNHPRDQRRVHNIARSIVILDEVQTLPRRLLEPLLGMIRELASNWGVTFVFSTATQPAFEHPPGKEDPRWAPGTLTEIIQAPAPLRQALKRAEIHWEVHSFWAWAQVCDRASRADQSLTIVNLRRHAAELFGEMRRRVADSSVVFHLSTRMCAAHRLRTLDAIRRRLRGGEPCHVVSTQLVEAGVDIDFPLVLRALAPLDAIVQAAGRADREGRLTAAQGRPGGIVVVFQPEDGGMPPHEYRQAAELTKAVVEGLRVAPDSVEAMRCFFERYYGEGADLGMQLAKMRKRLSFATLADEFEMISSRTRDVFVPDDDDARDAIAELQEIGVVTAGLRRRLQRHIVGLNPSEFDTARRMLFPLSPTEDVWIASEAAYTEDLGLHLEPEGAGVFV